MKISNKLFLMNKFITNPYVTIAQRILSVKNNYFITLLFHYISFLYTRKIYILLKKFPKK